jgi:hypothetical protein
VAGSAAAGPLGFDGPRQGRRAGLRDSESGARLRTQPGMAPGGTGAIPGNGRPVSGVKVGASRPAGPAGRGSHSTVCDQRALRTVAGPSTWVGCRAGHASCGGRRCGFQRGRAARPMLSQSAVPPRPAHVRAVSSSSPANPAGLSRHRRAGLGGGLRADPRPPSAPAPTLGSPGTARLRPGRIAAVTAGRSGPGEEGGMGALSARVGGVGWGWVGS